MLPEISQERRNVEREDLSMYVERAEIALGASLNPIANRRSGLRVTFFAFAFAFGLELHVLLLGQD